MTSPSSSEQQCPPEAIEHYEATVDRPAPSEKPREGATPRTDDVIVTLARGDHVADVTRLLLHARQLERELAEANATIKHLRVVKP